ncbi:MAG: ribonuclease HI family protein [Gemmataceae bacterium]
MSFRETLTIHTDGASRGNPGPAACGYVISQPGERSIEVNECLGHTTNNVAEYTALVKALGHAHELGGRKIKVFTDSELMVKQLKGVYKVKNEKIKPLYEQIRDLQEQFESVTVTHVRREYNSDADALCNEALDAGRTTKPKGEVTDKPLDPESTGAEPGETIHDVAIQFLQEVAVAWQEGKTTTPSPEEVWSHLWDALVDHGLVVPE